MQGTTGTNYEEQNLAKDDAPKPERKESENDAFTNTMYKQQAIVFTILQIISMIFYGTVCDFDTNVAPSVTTKSGDLDLEALVELITNENPVRQYYGPYQDVHVMIFVGFGFLMVFLKRNCWSSVCFNFLLAAWTVQMSILWVGFWHCVFSGHWETIKLNLVYLIEGDFSAGATLISFGAVLGKVNSMQLMVMATLEIFFYALNFQIGSAKFQAVDMGGSMFVHTFGAFFGCAVSWVITPRKAIKDHPKCAGGYTSQTIAFIGTIFLWMFWPSFNGALAQGNSQHRVIVNTVLALTGSCLGTFLTSSLFNSGKFNMEDVLNATLAGGVIIGSSSDLVVASVWSIFIGFIGGIFSTIGFNKVSPFLLEKIGLHDTCGVNNLHGIPGVLGGMIGGITASVAGDTAYGEDIGIVFPARLEGARTASEQAWMQIAALAVSLVISIGGGLITGKLVKLFKQPTRAEDLFEDEIYWKDAEPDTK